MRIARFPARRTLASLAPLAMLCACAGGGPPATPTGESFVPRAAARAAADPYACPVTPRASEVSIAGALRHPLTVNARYFTDDPYFRGFPPSRAPYFETATVPGMWDAHAIGLDFAWEYSQPANGSSVTQPLALGAPSVKVAVIDTGVDVSHPDLGTAKVVYAKCIVTGPDGVRSTSNFVTDENGHGTSLAGIVAADLNNRVGFAGSAGNASLMAYRVFPLPDDRCANPASRDRRCSATTGDVAAAIGDAANNGARVILLSVGGPCPDDPVEGTAVANAIARGIVVVAASGNDGSGRLDAPACDPGVIAVGASALADGKRNGTNARAGGQYVAGYSNYDARRSRWGLVAPGGDPYCARANACGDPDYLHWIYTLTTSTPLDRRFAGTCTPDRGNPTGPRDCRTVVAGTSMAAAHVAGIAALILSVNAGKYGTPSAMFDLLCATADSLGSRHQGCGRANAYRAMAYAVNDPHPPLAAALPH